MLEFIFVCLVGDMFIIHCYMLAMEMSGVFLSKSESTPILHTIGYVVSGYFLIINVRPELFADIGDVMLFTVIAINVLFTVVALVIIHGITQAFIDTNTDIEGLVDNYIVASGLPDIGGVEKVAYNLKTNSYHFYGERAMLTISMDKPQKASITINNGIALGECRGYRWSRHAIIGAALMIKIHEEKYPVTIIN